MSDIFAVMAMTDIKPEPQSSVPIISEFVSLKQLEIYEKMKYLDSGKAYSSDVNEDQSTPAVKQTEGPGVNSLDSKLTMPADVRSNGVKAEEKSIICEKLEETIKAEPLGLGCQRKALSAPVIKNSRPIQYVIVPSPNGTISKEKLQRFGLLCQQSGEENKATVTLNGNNVTLISADGQKLGLVNNWNGNLNSVVLSQNATIPASGQNGKPEAEVIKTERLSETKVNMTTHQAVQLCTPSKPTEPENRLPGTNLVYRTPGANNVNKSGKIKRPMNAFMVWARTYRAKLAEAFPNTTNSDVSIRLGQVWHEMTDEQKKPYYIEAERIKQRHKLQYPEWSYTPIQNRKRPEEESVESVAHNIYWSRYGNGSMNAEQQASNYLLTGDRTRSPGFVLQQPVYKQASQPVYNQASQPVMNMSYLTNVYRPVPLKPPTQPQQVKVEVTKDNDKKTTPAEEKNPDKSEKTVKHSKDCSLSKESVSTTGSDVAGLCCTCPQKEPKKRQRKPRTRRKDRKKEDENFLDGLQNDLRCQHLSGKLLDVLPPSDDGTLVLDDECPSDPYNPFYFLNLGEEYENDKDLRDVDVDRWRTYLGEKVQEAESGLIEPNYNLDVFLSEARVSGSTTSLASSDMDIIPKPLASTLDRLQKSDAGNSTWKSSSGGDVGLWKSNCHNRFVAGASKSHNNHIAGSRLGTPRPKDNKDPDFPSNVSPNGGDLFVINEEIVVTTSDTDHRRAGSVCGQDSGGAGDSILTLTPKPSLSALGNFPANIQKIDNLIEDGPKISPPGKIPCIHGQR